MGDHWMGEKDLFFDSSARIPLIVYDPRDAADASRGDTCDELVEGIDLAPTFMEFFGCPAKPHIIEGRSLQPIMHGHLAADSWRDFCVSEYDYSTREARRPVGVDQQDARMVMVFDGRWKYVHVENMRPMLFDLLNDPDELKDLGNDATFQAEIDRMAAHHFQWARQHHSRITKSAEAVEKMTDAKEPPGIIIGFANLEELEAAGLSARLPKHTVR